MRVTKAFEFILHSEWYRETEEGFFIPPELAPSQAIQAMENANKQRKERLEWLKQNSAADDMRKNYGLSS